MVVSSDDRAPSAEIPSGRFSMKKATYEEQVIHLVEAPKVPPFKNKETRKIVRFNKIVRVRSTLHVDDITDADFFNVWYSDDEMLAMKKNMKRDLKRFLAAKRANQKKIQGKQKKLMMNIITNAAKNNKSRNILLNNIDQYSDNYGLDSNKFTIRGLEHRTKEGSEIIRCARFLTLYAVLKEQAIQKASYNSYDVEAIRRAYQQSGTKLSALEANKIGIKDARDAKLISLLKEDNNRRRIISPFKIRINKNNKLLE